MNELTVIVDLNFSNSAWCYTTEQDTTTEYCNIPTCDVPTFCSITPQCNNTACIGTERPVFALDPIGTPRPFLWWLDPPEDLVGDQDEPHWNYNHSAWLPSFEDPRGSAWLPSFEPRRGFLFDFLSDLTAEKFMIDVFNEYIGCAVSSGDKYCLQLLITLCE